MKKFLLFSLLMLFSSLASFAQTPTPTPTPTGIPTPPWIQYTESVVGEHHPTLTDVVNRPLKWVWTMFSNAHTWEGYHLSPLRLADATDLVWLRAKNGVLEFSSDNSTWYTVQATLAPTPTPTNTPTITPTPAATATPTAAPTATPTNTPEPTATPTITPTPTPLPRSLYVISDTTDGSTTFTDLSTTNYTVAATGGIAHSTAQHVDGHTSSIAFVTGKYLSVPSSAEWNFGSDNFTIKCQIYPTTGSIYRDLFVRFLSTNDSRSFEMFIGTDNHLSLDVYTNGTTQSLHHYTSDGTISLNTWHTIVVGRDGESFKISIDSTVTSISASGIGVHSPSENVSLIIGAYTGTDDNFIGYMDNIEIIHGAWQP